MLKRFSGKKGEQKKRKRNRSRGIFLFINNWPLMIGTWLFLGMAPVVPEPIAFLKWGQVFAGGIGMEGWYDWWLLVLHSIPWILLARLIVLSSYRVLRWIIRKSRAQDYRKAREAQLAEGQRET